MSPNCKKNRDLQQLQQLLLECRLICLQLERGQEQELLLSFLHRIISEIEEEMIIDHR